MDSISQIVLGASVAEVCVGKKIGNKALLWGAVAGTIPDLDVLSNLWLDEFTAMTLHRGFTHSIIFCVVASPAFAWVWLRLSDRWGKSQVDFKSWTKMFFWCFATHIALDCFTTWGTHVFWPLNMPLSTNSIFVADPLYTLPFLIVMIGVMFFNKSNPKRAKLNRLGLILSTGYLFLALGVKQSVNHTFANSFKEHGFEVVDFESRPTPLNILLWTVNAEVEDGYYLGYYSVMDENQDIDYQFAPKNRDLLEDISEDAQVKKVLRMTQGWYTVLKTDSCILVNDLRFGQPMGWRSQPDEFVFQYQLWQNKDGSIRVGAPRPPRPKPEVAVRLLKAIFDRALGDKDA